MRAAPAGLEVIRFTEIDAARGLLIALFLQ
jgi:hypothetical protein